MARVQPSGAGKRDYVVYFDRFRANLKFGGLTMAFAEKV
jgi:hypothetical protein